MFKPRSAVRARALTGFSVLAVSLALTACGAVTSGPSAAPAQQGGGDPNRQVHYVMVLKTLTVGAANLGKDAAEKRAQELGNVKLDVVGPPTADPAGQVSLIEAAISQRADGIMVSALDSSVCSAVNEAVTAGIPVITFDSDCPGSKESTYVGTDNKAGGEAAGKLFADAVKGKGPQKIAILTGIPGASNLKDRDTGFEDALKAAGADAQVVKTISGNDDVNQSVDTLESFLQGDPSITGFFFDGPWPLLVDAKNIPNTVARAKAGMTIVSFDAIQPEMDSLRSGLATALVSQDYYGMSYQAVQVIDQIARHGATFGPVTATPLSVITKNGGPTAAGTSVTADEWDRKWDQKDWPQTPVMPAAAS